MVEVEGFITRPVNVYGKENAVEFTEQQLFVMLCVFGSLSFVLGCLMAVV